MVEIAALKNRVATATYIQDQSAFDTACATLSQSSVVAIDCEFERTRTYFPQPALIQAASESDVFLIDPLKIQNWLLFITLLENPAIIKVFHACQEDIQVLYLLCGVVPVSLFDTQLAMGFVGKEYPMSFKRVVADVCDIYLDKEAQRSDWLQRPLSKTQLEYAAADVVYLLPLFAYVYAQLKNSPKLHWLFDEILHQCRSAVDGLQVQAHNYSKIRGAHKLNGTQLARLQQLEMWRDAMAIQENMPKSWICGTKELLLLAETGRFESKLLSFRLSKLARAQTAQQLKHLCATTPAALAPLPGPFDHIQRDILSKLRSSNWVIAAKLNITAELLFNRKQCINIITNGISSVTGWRAELIEELELHEDF